jgi:hypothetical protein
MVFTAPGIIYLSGVDVSIEAIAAKRKARYERTKAEVRKKARAYYLANRERLCAQSREYGRKHRVSKAVKTKTYNEENKDHIRTRSRHCKTNREEIAARREGSAERRTEYQKEYYKKNKDRLMATQKLRRDKEAHDKREKARLGSDVQGKA